MNHDQIVKQSKNAYAQWCVQWRENAKRHAKYDMKNFNDFRNTGIGKAALLVANGYSFEENLEVIKRNHENVDIVACDKTLGHLIKNGIKPKFCVVCDANVNYEKYLKPYEDQLDETILFQNVCGNPLWSENGNWKDKYYYVNKDVMNYEREFAGISGCPNLVTAGTNVSNMMVVLLVQSDNEMKQNLFAYDKMIMIGFDYSWRFDGKYYSFDEDGGGKKYYMRHIYGLSNSGKIIFSSNNLNASASWLNLYIQAYKPNVIQCNPHALHTFGRTGDLETQMKYRHKSRDSYRVNDLLRQRQGIEQKLASVNNELRDIGKDHWYASHSI
jgi:hypothetical protein